MRFYGRGVAWDGERNKALAGFVGGVYETDDPRTIRILKERGYQHEEEAVPETINYDGMTYQELKVAAIARGIDFAGNISRAKLTELLRGAE